MDIWFSSVGRGANLILNVTPDSRGLIPAADSIRVMEFKAAREAYFDSIKGSCGKSGETSVVKLTAPAKCIVIQEQIKYGQRIKSFVVEALKDGEWQTVAEGTTVGHKRILRFNETVDAKKVRVRVTDSFAKPLIKSIELY